MIKILQNLRDLPGRLARHLGDRLRPLEGEHRRRGRAGERVAERYLRDRGYRVWARNLRNRHGELDLLVESPEGAVVVVEVKTGLAPEPGAAAYRPEWRVNAAKRRKITALATQLARRKKLEHRPWRFDVVGVEFARGPTPAPGQPVEPTVRHYIGAFDAGF